MNRNNYLVIMAGGIGSRFWPYSREQKPKQFQDILGVGRTFIQQTVERLEDVVPLKNVFVVTNAIYKDLVLEQLPFLDEERILCEPVMRNTAPCIAYAIWKISAINLEANIIVAPSDHFIGKRDAFQKVTLEVLEQTREKDILVTLGMTPHSPNTGYGYIKNGEKEKDSCLHKVEAFTEKPNLEKALHFLNDGNYFWNAGIFMGHVMSWKRAFKRFLPQVSDLFEKARESYFTEYEQEAIDSLYPECPNISVDYGIMERAENVWCCPAEIGWSDLGTWGSLYKIGDKDQEGNVTQGKVISYNTSNCVIKIPENKLAVVEGLQDFIVALNDGVLMICPLESEQKIKEFLNEVKSRGEEDFI